MTEYRHVLPGSYYMLPDNQPCPGKPSDKIIKTFEDQDLLTLLTDNQLVYPQSVTELYREFSFHESNVNLVTWDVRVDTVTFIFKNLQQKIPLSDFSNYLDLPSGGPKFYTKEKKFKKRVFDNAGLRREDVFKLLVKQSCRHTVGCSKVLKLKHLKEKVIPYYQVVRESIFGRPLGWEMGGMIASKFVIAMEAIVLYRILKHEDFDIGYVMANVMEEIGSSYAPLPFGMRLTHLFKEANLLTGPGYSVKQSILRKD